MKLRDYLRLGVIISPLPNDIQNGDPIDADPVMADLQHIVDQVNINVPAAIPTFTTLYRMTPELRIGGSDAGITYSAQLGYYQRIGNVVFYCFNVTLTSKGAATGDLTINFAAYSTNPVPPVATAAALNPATILAGDTITYTGSPQFWTQPNSVVGNLVQFPSAGSATTLDDTAITNGSSISAAGWYFCIS